MRWRTSGFAYALLLAGQTLAASALFWIVFPVFHEIVTNLGERQEMPPSQQLAVLGSAAFLHLCYWIRLQWVPIVAPFHSVFLGHVCAFASRISFIFGGALFSILFFRHLPSLHVMPPLSRTAFSTVEVIAILFGLYCYSRELDRLATAIEEPRV
ncbi:hypothetical protein [Pararhizobium antarcticum]|uniref:Uncharacterized protein n=1 Tax=Pararhizobium antarcticum TaxID=1798805 RepID=A0A657LUH1_9HYPH|nr:hypothetical protein [Pararhizobium antarcticum]OJF97415.1 hypothetical protein AX760_16980 [Pararhizobium antarcticum]